MHRSKTAPGRGASALLLCAMLYTLLVASPNVVTAQDLFGGGRLAAAVRSMLNGTNTNRPTCPQPGFDSVANLSVAKYAAAPWYVQKQAPVVYQPASELYCVRAIYVPLNASNPAAGLDVQNYANRGRVNGPAMGNVRSNGGAAAFRLQALPDPSAGNGSTASSKLIVGPAALKNVAPRLVSAGYGPYWVVAVGPSSNSTLGYDWAIVTGGAPRTSAAGGCRTGLPGPTEIQYIGGLWLFSRKPVDPEATAAMEAKAKALGLDTSILKPVQQQGCMYA